jgi:Fur family ferric uptake transcriptional regulator
MTRQRRVIMEELRSYRQHPTADELHRRVRERIPNISLGTVYRNLEKLSELGIIRRLDFGPQRRYDGRTDGHQHVRCIHCNAVADVQMPGADRLIENVQGAAGYELLGIQMEIRGICPECRKEHPASEGQDQ